MISVSGSCSGSGLADAFAFTQMVRIASANVNSADGDVRGDRPVQTARGGKVWNGRGGEICRARRQNGAEESLDAADPIKFVAESGRSVEFEADPHLEI